MLLNLLKRDLKLHWDALVIPLLLLLLIMGAIGIANEGAALMGLVFCSFLFIPVLPLALHVREVHTGTMGDLLALPVSRRTVVNLRYLEVLLLAFGLVTLAHLGTWVALSLAAHQVVPFEIMDRGGAFVMVLLLVLLFAYPMPFALRWGGKGAGIAMGGLVTGFLGLGFASDLFPKFMESFGKIPSRIVLHFMGWGNPPNSGHPGQLAVVFLGLFALSYLLSLKAFERRDF